MMPDARRRRPPLLGNLESTSTFKRFREGVEKATIGLAIPVRPSDRPQSRREQRASHRTEFCEISYAIFN